VLCTEAANLLFVDCGEVPGCGRITDARLRWQRKFVVSVADDS